VVCGCRTLPWGVNVSHERGGELEAVMSGEWSTGCSARGSECGSCTKAPLLLIPVYISFAKANFSVFDCCAQPAR